MDLLTMKKHDIIPEQAWNMLLSLPSHIEDFKANGNYSNIELMAMGASQFSLTQELFDKDFVAAMYARVGQPQALDQYITLMNTGTYKLLDAYHSYVGSSRYHHRPNVGSLQPFLRP
jgi:hypothetical protein